MNKYLIVATPEELALPAARENMRDRHIIVTGEGPLNVIKAVKVLPWDCDILNVGYAGSPDLQPGTAVCPSSVSTFHPCTAFLEPRAILHSYDANTPRVPCVTAMDFITSADNLPAGCVVDMELAFLAAFNFAHLVSVKYVSDNLNKKQYDSCLKK